MKNSLFGMICLSLASSIWGGTYVVSKYVLGYIPPFTLLFYRYFLACVVLGGLLLVYQRRKISKKDLWLFAWIGFIGYFVSVGTQFIGTKLSDAHTGALITSASPVFTILFARMILKERITLQKIGALVLSMMGVMFVIGWGPTNSNNILGIVYLVIAAVTWALLSVFSKVAAQTHEPLTVTTYALLCSLIYIAPVMGRESTSVPLTWHMNAWVWLGILYLGTFSTAGAFFLWNKGMELVDAGNGSLFLFFQPIIGTFLGWLILGEHLNKNFFIGGIFVLAGVLIVSTRSDLNVARAPSKASRN